MRTKAEVESELATIRSAVKARFDAAKGSPLFDLFCDEDDYIRPDELAARQALENELATLEPTPPPKPTKQAVVTPKKDVTYQCVLVGELWHLTQEQANPPPVLRMESWTSCAIWAVFKRGFERRLPTCPECMGHAAAFAKRSQADQ